MNQYNSFPRSGTAALCRLLLCLSVSILFVVTTFVESRAQSSSRPVARLITANGSIPAPINANHRVAPRTVTPTAPPVTATSLERRAFDLINAERVRNGLPALAWDGVVCRMARRHSEEMGRQNFFDHSGPDGDPRVRARANGISWTSISENIAMSQGYDDPVSLAVDQWMHSPGHRSNLLRRDFTHSAVGIARMADGRVYLTQVFIMR